MWWSYSLAFCLMLISTAVVLWLIDLENNAADPGPSWHRLHRRPVPPRRGGDRMPVWQLGPGRGRRKGCTDENTFRSQPHANATVSALPSP
jgi:hypothetical protein